jgi:heme exporter protein D
MREMLIEYQELSNCIKDIPIPWLLVPAGLAIAGWVFCGAVFSILVVESEAVWAAIGTFVTVFFFVIHKVWERGAALAKVGPGIQRERTDVEREGHTTGVELDQMTRIISGGAGEGLEEGR